MYLASVDSLCCIDASIAGVDSCVYKLVRVSVGLGQFVDVVVLSRVSRVSSGVRWKYEEHNNPVTWGLSVQGGLYVQDWCTNGPNISC